MLIFPEMRRRQNEFSLLIAIALFLATLCVINYTDALQAFPIPE